MVTKKEKEIVKKEKQALKNEMSEFKKFISRGNVVDMAVGVIVGAAFGKIVTSLVNDILMPIIGIFMGGLDFSSLNIKIKDATINYGTFIQAIIDFLIISFCIFTMIRVFEKFKHKEEKQETKKEETPKKSEEVLLLEQIRDLLKKKK